MPFWEILLICLSLSLDNFAVSASAGCDGKDLPFTRILKIVFTFVGIGATCLLLGFYGGKGLGKIIGAYDHWAAFFILAYIGTKMVLSIFKKENTTRPCSLISFKIIMIMALATNIDVLAVGISLALYKVNILLVLSTLCVCIATATAAGVLVGTMLGNKLGTKAEFLGGLVLLAISIKILLQG